MDLHNMNGVETLQGLRRVLILTMRDLEQDRLDPQWDNIKDVTKGTIVGLQTALIAIEALLAASGAPLEDVENSKGTSTLDGLSEFIQRKEPGSD